jgi:LmbE family N-acetylglucosaminyl deacetylase
MYKSGKLADGARPAVMNPLTDPHEMNRTVFAIGAHPDDIEFVMAGTMMLLKRSGYELHYMNVANGSCGSTQLDGTSIARIRADEARKAAAYIGATFHESLVNDFEIFYSLPLLTRLTSIIRQVNPSILLVHSPQDYMEDHTNACRLAVTAAFCRGMPNFAVDPKRAHINDEITIYHAQPHGNRDQFGHLVRPDLYVDISSVIESKETMLSFHESQKSWLDESQGMNSYLKTMREFAREVGEMSQAFDLAEGWRKHSPLGFFSTHADPLKAALENRAVALKPYNKP